MNPNAAAFALILKQRQQMEGGEKRMPPQPPQRPPPPPHPSNAQGRPFNQHQNSSSNAHFLANMNSSWSAPRPPGPPPPPNPAPTNVQQYNQSSLCGAFLPTVYQTQQQTHQSNYQQVAPTHRPPPPPTSSFHMQMAQYAQGSSAPQNRPPPPGSFVDSSQSRYNVKGNQKPQHQKQNKQQNQKKPLKPVEPSEIFYCEPCEREFKQREAYTIHCNAHELCPHEGCTFTASKKAIQTHHSLVHGLYNGSGFKTIDVEGQPFRVLLGTDPADVAQWREARKKRFPTETNTTAKRCAEEELERSGGIATFSSSSSSAVGTSKAGGQSNKGKRKAVGDSTGANTADGGNAGKKAKSKQRAQSGKLDIPKPLEGGERGTLLRKLLSDEITAEESIILQCLRFIVQNNFLNPESKVTEVQEVSPAAVE